MNAIKQFLVTLLLLLAILATFIWAVWLLAEGEPMAEVVLPAIIVSSPKEIP